MILNTIDKVKPNGYIDPFRSPQLHSSSLSLPTIHISLPPLPTTLPHSPPLPITPHHSPPLPVKVFLVCRAPKDFKVRKVNFKFPIWSVTFQVCVISSHPVCHICGIAMYYHGKEFCHILVRRWQFKTVFRSEVMSFFKNEPITTVLQCTRSNVISPFKKRTLPLIEIPF